MDAVIQWFKEYMNKSKERFITVANTDNSYKRTNKKTVIMNLENKNDKKNNCMDTFNDELWK